jgi:hypothetical protein
MASDISLAVGDGARRMTYAELAAVRGISALSAERLVRRKHWPRQAGNDGVIRVLVPLAEARKVGGNRRPARSGHPPLTSAAPVPDLRAVIREVIREISDAAPPDDRDDVRALEEREKLVTERDRFRALAEDRDRTIEQQQETIRDLRARLDAEAQERQRIQERLNKRLTHRQAGSVPTVTPRLRLPWWRRWFR